MFPSCVTRALQTGLKGMNAAALHVLHALGESKRLQNRTKMAALKWKKLWCNLGKQNQTPPGRRAKTVTCVINWWK